MKTTLTFLSLFLLVLSACQSAQPTQPEPVNVEPVQPVPVEPLQPVPVEGFPTVDYSAGGGGTGSGLCDNPYVPAVEGATWNYSLTTGSGTVTSVQTITDVGTDGFLLQTETSDISYVITWKCSPEGLYWLESTGGMFAAVFQTDAGTATVETNSYSGVSMPANVQVGDSWTTDEEITVNGFGVNETFTIHTEYQAVGMETVTVPAGTFSALRVDITISNSSQTLPVTIEGSSWFVEGIGQVKNVANNPSFDLELTSFSIP